MTCFHIDPLNSNRREAQCTQQLLASEPGGADAVRGTVVLIPATITRMGRSFDCEVLARRETLVRLGEVHQIDYVYTYFSVIGGREDLSDGEYLINFDGFTFPTFFYQGHWFQGEEESYRLAS